MSRALARIYSLPHLGHLAADDLESFGLSSIGLRLIDLTLPGVGLGATSIGRDRSRIESDGFV